MSHCPHKRERVTFQFLSGVGTWSLVRVICVLRDVKRLIPRAKFLSASSCCAAALGSDPVRRRSSAVWLSTRVSTMGLHGRDTGRVICSRQAMWSRTAWREAAVISVGTLPMRTVSRHTHGQQCCSANPCVFHTGHTAALIGRPRVQRRNAAFCNSEIL